MPSKSQDGVGVGVGRELPVVNETFQEETSTDSSIIFDTKNVHAHLI